MARIVRAVALAAAVAAASAQGPAFAQDEGGWDGGAPFDFDQLFGTGEDRENPSDYASDVDFEFEPDELVALNLSRAGIAAARSLGFRILEQRRLDTLGFVLYRLRPPRHTLAREALARLRAADPEGFHDVNPVYQLASGPPGAPAPAACEGVRCYGQALVRWPAGGCPVEARVGLVDSAVDWRHPALVNGRIATHRIQPGEAQLQDGDHGTAVAALLVGSPASGFAGLLPRAELVAADVFARNDRGQLFTDSASLAKGLDWVASRKPAVINLSVAGPDGRVLQAAIQRVQKLGIPVVAAAGNEGPQAPAQFPAAYPGVFAVTAVDRKERIYARANRGPYVRLAAPGVSIWTAGVDGPGLFREGTSFAAPFVTAAVALLKARQPGLDFASLAAALREPARDLGAPGPDPVYGWGLLQAKRCDG